VGLVEMLLGLLDWEAGGGNKLCAHMKWNEYEAYVGLFLQLSFQASSSIRSSTRGWK
ncbi:hypothetical protein MKX01_030329, partial [Papaver californicum]